MEGRGRGIDGVGEGDGERSRRAQAHEAGGTFFMISDSSILGFAMTPRAMTVVST
jgi:hypothetical protein